jgi:hypothetical protein
MPRSHLTEETVGKLFVDKDGNYWWHVSYCAYPTASVESMEWRGASPPTRRGGAVGSPILDDLDLRILVPEDDD